jgi:hypothetical protein
MNASLLPANTPLRRCRRAALYAAVLLGTALATTAYIPTALAQANTDQDDEMVLEEVIVTGYRRSLMDSTAAKRDSVGFTDEIFADDIGKLPSQNSGRQDLPRRDRRGPADLGARPRAQLHQDRAQRQQHRGGVGRQSDRHQLQP